MKYKIYLKLKLSLELSHDKLKLKEGKKILRVTNYLYYITCYKVSRIYNNSAVKFFKLL